MCSCGMTLDATARDHAGILAETGYTNHRMIRTYNGHAQLHSHDD